MPLQFVIERSRYVTSPLLQRGESPVRHSRPRRPILSRSPSRLPGRGRTGVRRSPSMAWGRLPHSSLSRALRLVVATGTAACAVSLVVAMVALVASMGSTGATRTSVRPLASDTAGHRRQMDHHPAQHQPDHLLIGRTLATYRGMSPGGHRNFQVSWHGVWGISWTFNCPAGRNGSFVMSESGGDLHQPVRVSTGGPAGHGIFWDTGDLGKHSLAVVSSCSWTVQVVLPRVIAGHQARGSGRRETAGSDRGLQATDHQQNPQHLANTEHSKQPQNPQNPQHPETRQHSGTPQRSASSEHSRRQRLSRRSAAQSGSASAQRSLVSPGRAARRPTTCLRPRRAGSAS